MYLEGETRLFCPQHLVNIHNIADPADIDSICNAFSFLTAQGYFTVRAEIFDEDGETVWGGDPAKTKLYENDLWNKKGDNVDFDECFIQVSFLMTKKFEDEIKDEEK